MAFVPYQIDYSVQNTAKTLGFSKKKVVFKFGFASQQAIRQKLTGAACRGSEHEVTFIWSLATGKRQLYLDGRDVHFSESGQNGWTTDRDWQFAFPLRDTVLGTLKVLFISQTVNREVADSKPFDLRVAGVSYFSFNQIFELGTPGMRERGTPRQHPSDYMSPEERRLVEQAKIESLREFEKQKEMEKQKQKKAEEEAPKNLPREEASLISFDDDPPVPQTFSGQQAPSHPNFTSSITLDPAIDDRANMFMQQLTPAQQPSQPYGFNMPYGYTQSPYVQQPTPGPFFSTPPTNVASTPYASAGGMITPYQQQQPPQTGATSSPAPSPWAYGVATPQSLTSPSNQSFSSFGSAPSFAQPPKPPPQQQQQSPYPQQPQYQQQAPYQQQPQQQTPYPPQQQQYQYQTPAGYGFAAPPSQPQSGYY